MKDNPKVISDQSQPVPGSEEKMQPQPVIKKLTNHQHHESNGTGI